MNLQGRNLQQGLKGDDVRLLQSELALLNVVIAESERLEAFFGPSTADAIKTFQKQHVLPTDGVVDAVTARAINAAVDALHPPSSTVSGRIYSAQRAGLGGLRIVVVDRNAGPDVLLAEGLTTDRGTYTIQYSTAALSPLAKTAPDLQVRVLAGTTLLAASDVRYGASPSEALDIVVSDESGPALASEHDSLTGAIGAHFKGNLAELEESATAGQPDQRSDITYLANKTGWDARAVALAALADQFSRRSGPTAAAVPPVFFYALFRAGLPANEDALYRLDAASLTRIWTAAAARGVMPPSAVDQIPRIAGMFQSLSAQQLLAGPALAGVSPVQEMLASVSKLSGAQPQQFATLYAAHRDNMPAFWTAVQGAFGNDTAARLQLDGKLAFLTHQQRRPDAGRQAGTAGAPPLTDPAQLAGRGFHRADKWKALLPANAAIPPEIPGETADARKDNYAKYLAAQVRLSYPTASVAEMVKGRRSAAFSTPTRSRPS